MPVAIAPSFIVPMQPTAGVLPEGPEWLYELKFDGFRCIAVKRNSKVGLYSRNGHNLTPRFPSVAKQIERLQHQRPFLFAVAWESIAFQLQSNGSHDQTQIRSMICFSGIRPSDVASIYELHHTQLVQFVRRRFAASLDKAEDVAQHTWLLVLQKGHTFAGGSIQQWLRTIAGNHFVSSYRRDRRLRFQTVDTPLISPSPLPAKELVSDALERLCVRDRRAVELVYFDKLSNADAGARLGVTCGALRCRLHRIRQRLRNVIEMDRQ